MEMFASEEPWEIIMTFTSLSARAVKMARATPGLPIIWAPFTLMRATPVIWVSAFTTRRDFRFSFVMQVPGCEGLKVFLTRMGIPFLMAGSMERGCITFAPK